MRNPPPERGPPENPDAGSLRAASLSSPLSSSLPGPSLQAEEARRPLQTEQAAQVRKWPGRAGQEVHAGRPGEAEQEAGQGAGHGPAQAGEQDPGGRPQPAGAGDGAVADQAVQPSP